MKTADCELRISDFTKNDRTKAERATTKLIFRFQFKIKCHLFTFFVI